MRHVKLYIKKLTIGILLWYEMTKVNTPPFLVDLANSGMRLHVGRDKRGVHDGRTGDCRL